MRSFRSKPVGWRNESYRHYLAAKGFCTKYYVRAPEKGVQTHCECGYEFGDTMKFCPYCGKRRSGKRAYDAKKSMKYKGYVGNIEKDTLKNEAYRKILFTGPHAQLVVQTLKPGEEIENEEHPKNDQFIRVEKGTAEFILGNGSKKYVDGDGASVLVPAGTWHQVVNKGKGELKLYTVYAPKNEPIEKGVLDKTMADALKREMR